MTDRFRRLYASLLTLWREDLRDRFIQCAAAFGILTALFFAMGFAFPELQEKFFSMTASAMEGVGAIREDGSIDSAVLLANNISACGFIMLYGFLPFFRLPALALGTNAMVLGCTAVWYVQNDISLLTFLAGILPHGVVEFPAMFLSFAMGLYICDDVSRFFRRDKTAKGPWACTVYLARVHLLALLPLLVAASLLEAYVTPWFLRLFL